VISAMMRLYEFAPTRSIRARWVLEELGKEFEAVTVNLVAGGNRRPEFLKINHADRIPALVDGDLVITESVAIMLYLAEPDTQRRFLPGASPWARRSTVGCCSPRRSWSSRYDASRGTPRSTRKKWGCLPNRRSPARTEMPF
jgi:glutathione S-transferase-like protein